MRQELPKEHRPNNAFNVLKDILPPQPNKAAAEAVAKAKQIRRFDFVEPIYMKKLLDVCGSAVEAGKLLGMSNTVVSESIRENRTRKINELGAKAVYNDLVPPPVAQIDTRGRVFVSMLIDRDAYDTLKPWLEQAGATHKTLI